MAKEMAERLLAKAEREEAALTGGRDPVGGPPASGAAVRRGGDDAEAGALQAMAREECPALSATVRPEAGAGPGPSSGAEAAGGDAAGDREEAGATDVDSDDTQFEAAGGES